MKVYIVIASYEYERDEPSAVFSTLEAAKAFVANFRSDAPEWARGYPEIYERELDLAEDQAE